MDRPAESTDVAIIGGGPIGLELAVALRAAAVPCVVLEAGAIGSTIGWWAPGTRIFSSPERLEIAGVPLVTRDQTKVSREQYLAYLRGVAIQFELPVRTFRRVTAIEKGPDGFRLTCRRSRHGVGGPEEAARADHGPAADGDTGTLRARRVVLAHGNMHRPRRLAVPGEGLPHVSHYFDDPHRYFGRRLLVVGGKNSAVEAALRCYRAGVDVTMSYRGDAFDAGRVKYWLRPEIEWLIDKGRIAWHPRTVPVEILPDRVRLGDAGGGEAAEVEADFVLLLTGYLQDPDLFEQLGLSLAGESRAPELDLRTMQGSVPGVYVAGTAVGGSQHRARVFIENSHVHVQRIVRAITGHDPPWPADDDFAALEES